MSDHVAVLMGGWSAEREVSLVSGKAVADVLRAEGYRVSEVDAGRDIARVLMELEPDVVFNALHGTGGEDGVIQGVLETLRLAYTHSGVLASAVAMNKPLAKRVFQSVGIPCPEGVVLTKQQCLNELPFPAPYVVKPVAEGSSVDVTIIDAGTDSDVEGWPQWQTYDVVLVERYIPGHELAVSVLGGRPLVVTELRPKSGFYDYQAKYTSGKTEHFTPAPIAPEARDLALKYAAAAHDVIGCRGITRTDFRYDTTDGEPGRLYLLELNTQPGLTPLSLVPEAAAHCGMDFTQFVIWMVEDASWPR